MNTLLLTIAILEAAVIIAVALCVHRAGKVTRVPNHDRRFGQWRNYLHVRLAWRGGIRHALFTDDQMQDALARADENPEDLPQ